MNDDRDLPTDEDEGSRSSRTRPRLRWWQEGVLLVVVAVGLAVVIKAVLIQAFYIPSESMEPGLVTNDRILVQKVSYWRGDPQRGDVVVFKDPGNWLGPAASAGPEGTLARMLVKVGLYPEGGHLVKRVIGVAGDSVECCDDEGRIAVNGVALDEDEFIAPQSRCNGPMTSTCTWTVPEVPADSLFVMGDNRAMSADSTVHLCAPEQSACDPAAAFVPRENVVGKVFALVWPYDHLRWVSRPTVFDDLPASATP